MRTTASTFAGSIPSSDGRVGLEVGEVVLLFDSRIADELRRLRAQSGEPGGRDRVREDDPCRGAQAELVLERRELVVMRRRARDAEASGCKRELVGAVGECDVEPARLGEAPERRQPCGEGSGFPEDTRPAVTWPDHVVIDSVQLEQLQRLGVLARAHFDLVSIGLQQPNQRAEEQHVR